MRLFIFETILQAAISSAFDVCPVISSLHLDAAQKLWNYLKVDHHLHQSDLIIGLGSHDVRVAIRAAELWHQGISDFVLFSGKSGILTKGKWGKSEAEIFRNVAVKHGVPQSRIILETNSTNTGENMRISYKLLSDIHRVPRKVVFVQKPYMGRRTLATFQKQWPDLDCKVFVTSPNISLTNYPNDDVGGLDDVITVLLGDMQRMHYYVKSGFQTYQYIPADVWTAYNVLKSSGLYNRHLV